jgi:FMN phosphatase YigB (HAD superfamily)
MSLIKQTAKVVLVPPVGNMIKAIVFDFFGVIGQSTWALIHEEYETTKEQDRQYKELGRALDCEYISLDDFLKSYAEVLGISYEEMFRVYSDPSKRFGASKKILEYIDDLRADYKIALLSNIVKEAALEFVEPMKEHFDVIVTSYQTKLAKPEVAIYELCAKNLA